MRRVIRKVRPSTHRGDGEAPTPAAGLSEDRLTLVERYMIDAAEAESRAQAQAEEASFDQATPSPNGDQPSADAPLVAEMGQREVDFEETRRELERESPELVADLSVDVALAAERIDEFVGVEGAEDAASGLVSGSDASSRPLGNGRTGDGLRNGAKKADELAEGEGSTPSRGAVDDGVTDVRLLEAEDQVGPRHGARRERTTTVPGQVDAPNGADGVSLGQGGNAVEVERPDRSHVNGKTPSEPSDQGGGERAAEAVPGADEYEGEPVFAGPVLPPGEQASARPRRRTARATVAEQTASRSRLARSHHLQRDGIPADSGSRLLMMTDAFPNRPTSLADYLEILHRRIWIILIPVVLAPILTYVISSSQKPVYSASSNVYINLTPATQTALGIFNQAASGDPTRYLAGEALLARDSALIASVEKAQQMPPGKLGSISSVSPSDIANVLIFTVQTGNRGRAATLANAYARAFTRFEPRQDAQQIINAISRVRRQIRQLRAKGIPKTSPRIATLRQEVDELGGGLAVLGNAPRVVQPAEGAGQVSPRPTRDAMLGLALGLVLGLGLAFLAEALDKRVRSEREIENILRLPLLARLPTPPRRLRRARELPILVEPQSPSAEAAKKLRTNLEFLTLDHEARVIMVTSALEQEGKSTTIASLAVALARSGRRVALVDLDLRKPDLHHFFKLRQVPGVIDVISGRCELSAALKPVLLPAANRRASRQASSEHSGEAASSLAVLPAGPLGPDPAFLVGNPRMTALIEQLKSDWDFVLVDAPPLPAVDDGLALSGSVDGVLVVTRSGLVPRRMLQELSRLLDSSPAEVLGFVLTGLSRSEAYGYGYGYGSGRSGGSGRHDEAQLIEAPTQDGSDRPRRVWSQR
jgi:succinoglycan biosynthesis transport protein ExoP